MLNHTQEEYHNFSCLFMSKEDKAILFTSHVSTQVGLVVWGFSLSVCWIIFLQVKHTIKIRVYYCKKGANSANSITTKTYNFVLKVPVAIWTSLDSFWRPVTWKNLVRQNFVQSIYFSWVKVQVQKSKYISCLMLTNERRTWAKNPLLTIHKKLILTNKWSKFYLNLYLKL